MITKRDDILSSIKAYMNVLIIIIIEIVHKVHK